MSKKSWHLSRRTFLQGSGVAMALPLLDSMADAADAAELRRGTLIILSSAFGSGTR